MTTLAGSGPDATSGTGASIDGTGAAARFDYPVGITIDNAGNLYVTEGYGSKIRKVTLNGVVTTIAGSNTRETRATVDGTGSGASFNYPWGITVGSDENLYVTELYGHKIRKVTPEGVVTTLAGANSGFDDGNGIAAKFGSPSGITSDNNGNLYVADPDNYRIRKVTLDGVVTTIAGSGIEGLVDGTGAAASFKWPRGLTTSTAGNLYVTEHVSGKVRKITLASTPTPVTPPPAGQYGSMNIPTRIYINSASTGRVFGGGFTNGRSFFYSDNGTDWTTLNTLPSDQYWTHGVYLPHANRYIMMSGDPAKLSNQAAYSDDGGQTWTAATLPYNGAWIYVEYNENILVATNSQGNTAAYSTNNGATWTGITMPSNGTPNTGWNQIAYGNGVFVAVAGGYDSSLHRVVGYSENGINWTTKTISATDRNWGSISFGNGKFVLLVYNNSGTCFGAHSTDGIHGLSIS